MVLCLTQLGWRSLDLRMIREQIIHNSHFRLGFRQIRLGNDLGHLLSVDLAGIVQIIVIVIKVETIFDRVTGSTIKWAVF